ncbi:MAG TPA: hypothetical protein VN958_15590, partial [Chitinophagaceae bacterium]|nr:hypothetical protein [Chitinophagaceae bacterium]
MKKTILFAVLAITSIAFNACYNSNASLVQKEIISFYEVPLVCSADPDIGCGSRSKPALLELEKNPSVKEAWLNREGTILAIVWKNKDETETVAKPVFNENN